MSSYRLGTGRVFIQHTLKITVYNITLRINEIFVHNNVKQNKIITKIIIKNQKKKREEFGYSRLDDDDLTCKNEWLKHWYWRTWWDEGSSNVSRSQRWLDSTIVGMYRTSLGYRTGCPIVRPTDPWGGLLSRSK